MAAKPEKKPTPNPKQKDVSKTNKRKYDDKNNANWNRDDTPANKKRALKKYRQSFRRHNDEVSRGKEIWNKLRIKTNDKATVEKLMTELMGLLKGRASEVAFQHDASRVVQAAVQFGNKEQRGMILMELKDHLVHLAKFQYSHFVVLKLIKLCGRDAEWRKVIVKSIKGNVPKLSTHAVGARVIELLFATFPPSSTLLLRQEYYGPQFSLFKTGALSTDAHGTTLRSILSQKSLTENENQRSSIVKYVNEIITRGTQKGMYHFAFFQTLAWDYVSSGIPTSDIRAIASGFVDNTLHCLSTRAGAKVMAECAAYATVKDRRRMLKCLKGYARSSLLHDDAYITVLRLCDVVDDTVSVQKCLLNELLVKEVKKDGKEGEETDDKDVSPLLELALSDTASKLFLMLLSSTKDGAHFDPPEMELLKPDPTVEEKGEQVPTSKKNNETRRTELIMVLRAGLEEMCTKHAADLMTSVNGSKVLNAFCRMFPSAAVANALVAACREMSLEKEEGGQVSSVFDHPVGHVCIKNLLLMEVTDEVAEKMRSGRKKKSETVLSSSAEDGVSLATALHKEFEGELVKTVALSNRGAFVLATLAGVEAVHENVKKEVLKSEKDLKAKAKTKKGYNVLLEIVKS